MLCDESDDILFSSFDWAPLPEPLDLPPLQPDPGSIQSLTFQLPPLVLPPASLGVQSYTDFVPRNVLARLRVTIDACYQSPAFAYAMADAASTVCAAVEMMNEATLFSRVCTQPCDLLVYHARRKQAEHMLRVAMAPFSTLTDTHTEPLPECVAVVRNQRGLSEKYPFRLPHTLDDECCAFLRECTWGAPALKSLPRAIAAHAEARRSTSLSGPSVMRPLADTSLPTHWANRARLMCDAGSDAWVYSPTCVGVMRSLLDQREIEQQSAGLLKQGISALRLHHDTSKSSAFARKRPLGSRHHVGLARLILFLLADKWRRRPDYCCAALVLFSRVGTTPTNVDFDDTESAVDCIVGRKRRKIIEAPKPKVSEQSVLKFA